MTGSLFTRLGIEVAATEAQVRTAYKKLALKHHPDKNKGDPEAHKEFLKISEAYKRITDPDSFKDEDDEGEMTEAEMQAMFGAMFRSSFHLQRVKCIRTM